MPLTVGTDTYISLVDANTYVTNNYVSTDTERTIWEALTDANKEIYLRKAASKIDRQPIRGIKSVQTQTMQFPRAMQTDYYLQNYPNTNLYYDADWLVETEVAQSVKDAQVEEALALAKGVPKRSELQAQGVKSFRLGNMSENYGSGTTLTFISQTAKELLRKYLAGSVPIC